MLLLLAPPERGSQLKRRLSMRTYEAIFIVHPEVTGDDLTAVTDKYKTVLTDQGANVLKVENWGTRTLAYPVKKQTKGCYVLVIFDAEPGVISEFERRMRIDDKVIKFQTVYLEGGYQAPPAAEEPTAESAGEGEEAEEEMADAGEEADESTEED
jgi:small subunit ribosomal protein S6